METTAGWRIDWRVLLTGLFSLEMPSTGSWALGQLAQFRIFRTWDPGRIEGEEFDFPREER